jgi:hypothetical protein
LPLSNSPTVLQKSCSEAPAHERLAGLEPSCNSPKRGEKLAASRSEWESSLGPDDARARRQGPSVRVRLGVGGFGEGVMHAVAVLRGGRG